MIARRAIARLFDQVFIVLVGLCALVFISGESKAMKIQEVTSPGGIKAWLVEEHSIPLMAMRFAFRGGAAQDSDKKPGVANFLTTMLDEGADDMPATQFQAKLDELAVRLRFTASRDSFAGDFQTLTVNRGEAVELLRMALIEPRFDEDALERMRRSVSAGIVMDSKDPDKIASREWFRIAFDGHPYARSVKGSVESVRAITADDLIAFHKRNFAKDNLKVAVVGDIDADTLGSLLDKVFGGLPEKSEISPVEIVSPKNGPIQKVIQMDVPQSVAQFGHGGIKRKDEDFIAAYVLNYILGGGGFSSRLTEEVREKRGLAYSVYSYVYPYEHTSIYVGGVATKNEGIAESLKVIRNELKRMADAGPTEQELSDAKQYLTGSYALRFDTSSKIASQLLWIQTEDLGIDYVDTRNGLIEAITIEDIKRVAKRLLKPESLIVTIVGRPLNLKDDG